MPKLEILKPQSILKLILKWSNNFFFVLLMDGFFNVPPWMVFPPRQTIVFLRLWHHRLQLRSLCQFVSPGVKPASSFSRPQTSLNRFGVWGGVLCVAHGIFGRSLGAVVMSLLLTQKLLSQHSCVGPFFKLYMKCAFVCIYSMNRSWTHSSII